MKKALLFILISVAILVADEPKIIQEGSMTTLIWTRSIDLPNANTQIEIDKIIGDLYVNGNSGSSIDYTEKISIKTKSEREAMRIWNEYHTTFEKTTYGYSLIGSQQKYHSMKSKMRFEYQLDVPTQTNLACKLTAGDLEINNLSGEIVIATYGGDIELSKLSGSLQVSTAGGDIEAKRLEGNLNLFTAGGDIQCKDLTGQIEIETAGGDIELERINGNLQARTFGGDIFLEELRGEKTELKTLGGDLEVFNITADLDLKSSGGDIQVKDLKGNMSAETAGGDIECQNISGSAEIETAAGDISVYRLGGSGNLETMNGSIELTKYYNLNLSNHDLTLSTENGDIDIVLPTVDDIEIDARARGYEVSIESVFPLEISRKDSRRINASYNKGAGKYSIELYTEDGDITITKGK